MQKLHISARLLAQNWHEPVAFEREAEWQNERRRVEGVGVVFDFIGLQGSEDHAAEDAGTKAFRY